MKKITLNSEPSVQDYLNSLTDPQTLTDAETLIEMMKKITHQAPQIWNVGTIGFDNYHYKYESGREGDSQALGFYPRKGQMTIYLMDGTAQYADLFAQLGKHTTSRVCVYIKRLSDIDLSVLEEILKKSYHAVKSQDGQMQRVR